MKKIIFTTVFAVTAAALSAQALDKGGVTFDFKTIPADFSNLPKSPGMPIW